MNKQDVAIVGAGIIGATLAWKLAKAGARVTVVDSGDRSDRVSDGSLAWLNASSTSDIDYARLRAASMKLWQGIAAAHPDCPVSFQGSLLWGDDPDACDDQAVRMAQVGWQAEVLADADVAGLVPGMGNPPEAALSAPDEGVAYPEKITDWMRDKAEDAGAVRVVGQAARLESGAVSLADGHRIEAGQIVVAAGNGSRALCATAGLDLPMRESPGIVMQTDVLPRLVPHVMATPHLDFWQGEAGRVLMSSSLSKTPGRADDLVVEDAVAILLSMFPGLEGAEVVRVIRRNRPIPEDGFPLVGALASGLWVAATHSGMTLAPVIAAALTERILGRPVQYDLSRYRPDRQMEPAHESSAL